MAAMSKRTRKPAYEILEPAHVELRVGARVIERTYEPGPVEAGSEEDRLALEHVVYLGAARVVPAHKLNAERPEPAPPAPEKEE